MKNFSKNIKTSRGFTLLEMIVAIGIFTIVMLMATSALVTIIGANRKVQSQQVAINNLNFALESKSIVYL